MVRLVIEANSQEDLELAMEHVSGLIEEGFTSGFHPYWEIREVIEE